MRITCLFILLIIFYSCKKDDIKPKNDLIGCWIIYNNNYPILSFYKNDFFINNYGINFKSDNTLVERKNEGWCGTPPIIYKDFKGEWMRGDSLININVEYWGGLAYYKWKILSINNDSLKILILEEEYF